jgi:hypothetical protein
MPYYIRDIQRNNRKIPKHLKVFACGSLRAILPTNLAKATACQAQKNHSKPLREAKA